MTLTSIVKTATDQAIRQVARAHLRHPMFDEAKEKNLAQVINNFNCRLCAIRTDFEEIKRDVEAFFNSSPPRSQRITKDFFTEQK